MRSSFAVFTVLFAVYAISAYGDDSTTQPRPTPLTRPQMKQFLEDMKDRTPRIPLPELTEEERAKLGERGGGYEGRLRSLYLPEGDERRDRPDRGPSDGPRPSGGGGRDSDPKMTLDYRFKTSLFWIASRTNNCQYCLGHQESKLLRAGMAEDEIAALDGDWLEFTPAEQAAFALARRLTLEPHLVGDADIEKVRKHYTDLQILEMVLSVAGNNSINRWKEGVGVPQSQGGGGFGRRPDGTAPPVELPPEKHSYLTPTSEKNRSKVTRVAQLVTDEATGKPSSRTVMRRPDLESPTQVEKALDECRKRTPRLPLIDEQATRDVLGDAAPEGELPQWARLLANFPEAGKRQVASIRSADEKGDLSPLLKAQVSWIIARQDRAWYAVGQAQKRLTKLGQSREQVFALDGDWSGFTETERALFTVARKLAASPVVLTDDDVAAAVKLAGPRDVVQLISYTTNRASFNRITEAAGLQLEP
jgi:alkylhydroperoxidase family enzyme